MREKAINSEISVDELYLSCENLFKSLADTTL